MSHAAYKHTLEAAKAEMNELLRQRKDIDTRIGKLAPVIEYLSVLCGEILSLPPDLPTPSQIDMGLSDAIRLALKSALPASLTRTEVRDKLREAKFNLDKYTHALSVIHNTIARLKVQGEVEEIAKPNGAKAYRLVSSLKRALLEIEPSKYGVRLAALVTKVQEQVDMDATPEVKEVKKDMQNLELDGLPLKNNYKPKNRVDVRKK